MSERASITAKQGSRAKWVLLICAVLAVALGIVITVALREGAGSTSAASPAVVPEFDLHGHDPEIVSVIERARDAVKASPRSGAAWGTLGAILVTHKLHKEALQCLAEAERLQPQEPRWAYLQGVTLLSSDPDAAIPKLARAADLTGDTPPAPRLRLADLLIERGLLDEAEKYLRPVAAKFPDEPHAELGLGKLEMARGHLAEALKYLERCAANPQTARAGTALIATIQQRLGNSGAAEEASRRVATLPQDPPLSDPFVSETSVLQSGMQAWLTQADRLVKSGRISEGLALFEKTVATYPDAAIAWQLLGQANIDGKNFAAAEKALRKAIELAPTSAESHFQLATACFEQSHLSEAIAALRRSIELRPTYAPGHYNLGILLAHAQQHGEAIEAFREAIRLAPSFSDAHRWLGATLAMEERFSEALGPLRRALDLNPADQAAKQMLERAEARSKEPGAK